MQKRHKVITKERFYLIPRHDQYLEDGSLYQVIQEDTASTFENHFTDLYKFFLRRLGQFEVKAEFSETEAAELAKILKELIDLKRTLESQ
ncbi:MAG TPA: hypothetical protein VFA52_02645 [Candidatus Paceibacterota bacterium]|nr:hypothetical protein [Candidatus Paceibacterota bacterium]